MFTDFPWLYVIAFSFKQLPLNLTLCLLPKYSNEGLRKLLGAEGRVMPSSDNPLDFHGEI